MCLRFQKKIMASDLTRESRLQLEANLKQDLELTMLFSQIHEAKDVFSVAAASPPRNFSQYVSVFFFFPFDLVSSTTPNNQDHKPTAHCTPPPRRTSTSFRFFLPCIAQLPSNFLHHRIKFLLSPSSRLLGYKRGCLMPKSRLRRTGTKKT